MYNPFDSDPNYNASELNWPRHNTTHEFYMDIGTHMIEKSGLFLDRYAIYASVWEKFEYSSSASVTITVAKILLFLLISLFIN